MCVYARPEILLVSILLSHVQSDQSIIWQKNNKNVT